VKQSLKTIIRGSLPLFVTAGSMIAAAAPAGPASQPATEPATTAATASQPATQASAQATTHPAVKPEPIMSVNGLRF
jgi:hypothetical protein